MGKQFLSGVSILVGTCIGAGVLGIPFVVSKAGFLIGLAYIVLIGLMILFINLYFGEVILRTKGRHQLSGYAKKYLGRKGERLMQFALIFGIYSAIIAYLLGVGNSLSFLFWGNLKLSLLMSFLFFVFMSFLLWKGLKVLKKFEKWGVGIVLILMLSIVFLFISKVDYSNLSYVNINYLFLPFGVVLFSLLSFSIIPEVSFILKDKKSLKNVFIVGSFVSIIFYALFAFMVVGFKGLNTPNIATFALGPVFIFLGIFTMFTSYFALGNALRDYFHYDESSKKFKSWFFSAIVPFLIFLLIKFFKFFSFTKILSIGGVVSGGLTGILILLMIKKAKLKGNRKPEYSIPIAWGVIIFFILIFTLAVLREILVSLR